MHKQFVAFAFSAAAVVAANAASAADLCQLPGPPPDQSLRPAAPVKPTMPPCVHEGNNAAACRPAVVKAYNAAIDAYNVALTRFNADGNDYIEAVNHWARTGVDYANCEVQSLNHEVER